MFFVAIAVASWGAGFLAIDWRDWRKGYPTALAGSLGSCLLDMSGIGTGWFWRYHSAHLQPWACSLLLNISLYPIGAWVFVQRYPSTMGGRIFWVLLGDVLLLVVEAALRVTRHMQYGHGWNLMWSALANLFLLVLLRLHFRMAESGSESR